MSPPPYEVMVDMVQHLAPPHVTFPLDVCTEQLFFFSSHAQVKFAFCELETLVIVTTLSLETDTFIVLASNASPEEPILFNPGMDAACKGVQMEAMHNKRSVVLT